MKYIKIALFLGCVLAVDVFLIMQIQKSYADWYISKSEFSVRPIFNHSIGSISTFDLQNDGADEFIARVPEKSATPGFYEIKIFHPFSPTNVNLNFFLHMEISVNYVSSNPVDINNDGNLDIPFLGVKDSRIFFECRNMTGNIIHSIEMEELSWPIPQGRLEQAILAIDDMDGDGTKEVVWRFSARFSGLPRGYACHDPETGKKKWEFLSAASPFKSKILDINRDGKKELVFSLNAPHNGITYKDTDDDTSYIGVINSSGIIQWMKKAGGFYTDIYFDVGDINGDGKYELVTGRSCHRAIDPDPGEIKIYDLLSGEELNKFVIGDVSFSRLFLTNMNDTSAPEIVVGDSGGFIRIFDKDLKIINEVKTGSVVKLLGVDGFTPESPLIFAFNHFSKYTIFDKELKRLFYFKIDSDLAYSDPITSVSYRGEKFFIINADRPYLISKNISSLSKYRALLFSNFSLFMLIIFSFNLLVFLFLRERKKRRKSPTGQTDLLASNEWTEMALDLAHRMKTPLTGILWESEKLKSSLEKIKDQSPATTQLKEIPDAILADINELKLMNRFLMRFLQPQKFNTRDVELNDLITGVVNKYARFLEGKIDFVCHLDAHIPPLELDEDQVREALSNIIENAIDAMPEGGKIEISTNLTHAKRGNNTQQEVMIQITDNGPGIPEDNINDIFNPYYTTKKEGFGIGLTITRKIIEGHGGRIYVESSEEVGTKFAIYIPGKVQK
ncbi:MAG: ATP-binding protein [Candidatus Aminicenantes bacterium]|nr:ATP-binding protein [Candidatus Aminicenantes bacterium]